VDRENLPFSLFMSMFPASTFSTLELFVASTLFDSFGASSTLSVSSLVLSFCVCLVAKFWMVSSSATKEVVILTRGKIVILEAWLNTAMETPAAASSSGPIHIQQKKENKNKRKKVYMSKLNSKGRLKLVYDKCDVLHNWDIYIYLIHKFEYSKS